MKKNLLIITFFLSFFGHSQIIRDTLYSKKLAEKRIITISLPDSYKKDSKKTYPLLFLLDGDYLVDPFRGVLNYGNFWDDLPEVIIVGINQNDHDERIDDCTVSTEGLPTERGAKFFEFIGGEVMPYIENKLRINNFRIIGGHDLTAGFLNFFLYKESPLFNAFISLSPEYAMNMEERITERLGTLKKKIFYYQAIAEGDTKEMKAQIKTLDEAIIALKSPNLNYKFEEIKNASHYSMVVRAIPNALYQFFEGFQPISNNEYTDKILVLKEGYVKYLLKRSENLEKELGYKIPIRYNDFKVIQDAILTNKAYNELEELATLANKTFPKKMLGEYLLGQLYENKEDYKRASKSYLNAFQMDSIGDLKKQMMMDKSDEMRSKIGKPQKK